MIAFTNHALDHLLCSVLDTGITKKIVRFGHSKNERIADFSLKKIEEVAGRSRLDRAFSGNYHELRSVEEDIKKLMSDLRKIDVDSDQILSHMEVNYPGHFDFFNATHRWIQVLYLQRSAEGPYGWRMAGPGGRDKALDTTSLYAFWLAGHDIDFLEHAHAPPPRQAEPATSPDATSINHNRYNALADGLEVHQALDAVIDAYGDDKGSDSSFDLEDDDSDIAPEEAWRHAVIENPDSIDDLAPLAVNRPQPDDHTQAPHSQVSNITDPDNIHPADFYDVNDFFVACGLPGIPSVPQHCRSLEMLLENDCEDLWAYSKAERKRLHVFMEVEVRTRLHQTQSMKFERLRQRHRNAVRKYKEGKDEVDWFHM